MTEFQHTLYLVRDHIGKIRILNFRCLTLISTSTLHQFKVICVLTEFQHTLYLVRDTTVRDTTVRYTTVRDTTVLLVRDTTNNLFDGRPHRSG